MTSKLYNEFLLKLTRANDAETGSNYIPFNLIEEGMEVYSIEEETFLKIKKYRSLNYFDVVYLGVRSLDWTDGQWRLFPTPTYKYIVLGRFTEETSEINRKDYCYTCKSDKLTWNMMAARCATCNKIILGG